jgi:hypothetical protein
MKNREYYERLAEFWLSLFRRGGRGAQHAHDAMLQALETGRISHWDVCQPGAR